MKVNSVAVLLLSVLSQATLSYAQASRMGAPTEDALTKAEEQEKILEEERDKYMMGVLGDREMVNLMKKLDHLTEDDFVDFMEKDRAEFEELMILLSDSLGTAGYVAYMYDKGFFQMMEKNDALGFLEDKLEYEEKDLQQDQETIALEVLEYINGLDVNGFKKFLQSEDNFFEVIKDVHDYMGEYSFLDYMHSKGFLIVLEEFKEFDFLEGKITSELLDETDIRYSDIAAMEEEIKEDKRKVMLDFFETATRKDFKKFMEDEEFGSIMDEMADFMGEDEFLVYLEERGFLELFEDEESM